MTPYDQVRHARRRVVGTRQVMRGEATLVVVAQDAEPHVVRDLIRLCQEKDVPVVYVDSMAELGRACGIQVGAASAAVLKEVPER